MAGNSTYEPRFRRFFGPPEHARELRELSQLYDGVVDDQTAFLAECRSEHSGVSPDTAIALSVLRTHHHRVEQLHVRVREPVHELLVALVAAEEYLFEIKAPDFATMSFEQLSPFRQRVYDKQHFFENKQRMLELLDHALERVMDVVLRHAPFVGEEGPLTIPFGAAIADPKRAIQDIQSATSAQAEAGILSEVAAQLWRNLLSVSGQGGSPDDKKLIYPTKTTMPAKEATRRYLVDTPFLDLFNTPVPLNLTRRERFAHMHVLGGSGSGKTTLIENLLLHDMQSDDPPSLVIIDPHGDLLRKFLRADLGIEERLIYINPRDIQHPPQLNVFALNQARMQDYNEVVREQVTAGVIETFDYFFTGLLGADLTAKQTLPFRMMARLLLTFPATMGRNATILDMVQLVDDPAPYQSAIEALPTFQRTFFERDFFNKNGPYKQTKEQIRYRLQGILENPTVYRLLTAEQTKADLFSTLNDKRGSIVIVDCAHDFLKAEGAAVLGKIFIALTLQAVEERAALPEHARKDTFLIVDEAASFFSHNIDGLLTSVRKYRCGCLFSHQYLDQAAGPLKASLASNTGIKMVSGVSASDARAMAAEMRTTPDFILSQPRLSFATHVRGAREAVAVPVSPLEPLPQLSDAAFDRLIERNRERVWSPGASQPFGGQNERGSRKAADW